MKVKKLYGRNIIKVALHAATILEGIFVVKGMCFESHCTFVMKVNYSEVEFL